MGNKNSSNSKVHFKTKKVSSIEQNMTRFRTKQGHRIKGQAILRDDEFIGKHKIDTPLDNDETFSNFIRRAKYKIRTVTMSKSNIDREESNNTVPADYENYIKHSK
ncbi:unnamed protein product [Vicia faba]|uniref:Uncharacterized protein n=1 Tax=Vicia faba TaxID=3906 RepID=A0AAV1AZF6_VICFA|nr:unnamed protein product [Vicia faba]